MKRIIRNMIILLAGMALLASCRVVEKIDDNIYIPNLGGQEIPEDEKNEIDKWLVEQFTDTYNIEVIYRWDAAQMHSDYDHKIIPVEYS